MTIKEILSLSALEIGRDDLVDYFNGGAETSGQSQASADADKMFACYKLVVSELSEEFYPLTKTETLTSESKRYYYSQFSITPIEIKAVYVGDKKVDYTVTPFYFSCDYDSVSVVYEYYPSATSIAEECPYANTKISGRIVALGVAREFLLVQGLYDQAVIFSERFTNALSSVLVSKGCGRIKARGWF